MTIKNRIWIIFLSAMYILTGSAAFAAEPAGVFWWELKGFGAAGSMNTDNGQAPVSMKRPNTLLLYWSRLPFAEDNGTLTAEGMESNGIKAWIRGPDSALSDADLSQKEGATALDFPSRLSGLYLIGARMDVRSVDIDSDGRGEEVHYYSKYLLYHQDEGGIQGDRQDVFFNDPDKIALEIGPVDTQNEKGETLWREAAFQEALKKHRMKVLYKGKPLADADVAVFTEDGWKKRAKTDTNGIFTFIPLQGIQAEEKVERCLYAAAFRDPLTGQYHCSSLMTFIKPHHPLYDSKARGFNLWAVLGVSLFLLYVATLIYRKKRRADKNLAEFERHKIKED